MTDCQLLVEDDQCAILADDDDNDDAKNDFDSYHS